MCLAPCKTARGRFKNRMRVLIVRRRAVVCVFFLGGNKTVVSQFVSSGHKMLVDEVTQIGLIESCLLKMSKIRGALG
jgi:hypothetical protein